jgi:hypothetical protein
MGMEEAGGLGSPGMRLVGPGWVGWELGGARVADAWRAADARVVRGDRASRGDGVGGVAGVADTFLCAEGTLLETSGTG